MAQRYKYKQNPIVYSLISFQRYDDWSPLMLNLWYMQPKFSLSLQKKTILRKIKKFADRIHMCWKCQKWHPRDWNLAWIELQHGVKFKETGSTTWPFQFRTTTRDVEVSLSCNLFVIQSLQCYSLLSLANSSL
jgi:hypothetical protein